VTAIRCGASRGPGICSGVAPVWSYGIPVSPAVAGCQLPQPRVARVGNINDAAQGTHYISAIPPGIAPLPLSDRGDTRSIEVTSRLRALSRLRQYERN
jgi:hypothetical protein